MDEINSNQPPLSPPNPGAIQAAQTAGLVPTPPSSPPPPQLPVQHQDSAQLPADVLGDDVERVAEGQSLSGYIDRQAADGGAIPGEGGPCVNVDVLHVSVLTKVHCALLRWEHAFDQGKHPDRDEIIFVRKHVEFHLASI